MTIADFYMGVRITRLPPRRDYQHERMWGVARPRNGTRRRYSAERLDVLRGKLIGLCDRGRRNR